MHKIVEKKDKERVAVRAKQMNTDKKEKQEKQKESNTMRQTEVADRDGKKEQSVLVLLLL